mgnify:FL=1
MEVKTGEQKFEKRFIEVGISDGKNIEIISGLKQKDEIKVWNKKAKQKDDQENTDGVNDDENEDDEEIND